MGLHGYTWALRQQGLSSRARSSPRRPVPSTPNMSLQRKSTVSKAGYIARSLGFVCVAGSKCLPHEGSTVLDDILIIRGADGDSASITRRVDFWSAAAVCRRCCNRVCSIQCETTQLRHCDSTPLQKGNDAPTGTPPWKAFGSVLHPPNTSQGHGVSSPGHPLVFRGCQGPVSGVIWRHVKNAMPSLL